MTSHDDDQYIGPPTGPVVGPPIPGKSFGQVPIILPDHVPPRITPEQPLSQSEAKARALWRAIHVTTGPWKPGGW
jgi:hypothetical protein